MMKRLGIVCLCALITSCSTVAPPSKPAPQPVQTRKLALNQIHSWSIQGKIAARTSHDAGSATVNWLQQNKRFDITLSGPLGSNTIKLNGKPGHVTLTDSAGKKISATSPEDLLAQIWGFRVPVSNLNYWVRGLPAPGLSAQKQYDSYGRLSYLTQQSWRVQYLGYTDVNQTELPSRITITSPELTVKLIIYSWRI